MRIAIAFSLSLTLSLSFAASAKRTRTVAHAAVALPAHADCPRSAPQPGGVCAPYDREHCRFSDGTLLIDDPRDERAPYLLKPVGNNVYCRFDSALQPAGLELVPTPAEQRAKWDATKARRHHG